MGFSPGNFRGRAKTPQRQGKSNTTAHTNRSKARRTCPPTDFRAVQLEALIFFPRKIVTTMLSSVVAVTQNSPQSRQSAQRKGLLRHGLPTTALSSRHPLLTRYVSLTPGFLIANPELEFPASHCKQRSELFSNRKFSTVFRSPQRMLDPALPGDPGTILILPFFSSSLQPQALSLQLLIVTPRLEFLATPTKQNSKPISNRYKTPFFAPAFPLITHHSSLARPEEEAEGLRRPSVAPTSRKAIMSRNHFNQIPRSKPLMRKVTNADPNQS